MTTLRNILIGVFILVAGAAHAEPIGDIISYQGKLTNADGTPVANGTQSVTFSIYENGAATGYNQTMPVATLGGVFSAFLSIGALTFDPAKQYELGVTFGGKETKHQIASVPVAKIAEGNVKKTGDTMSGDLNMGQKKIVQVRGITGLDSNNLSLVSGNNGQLVLEYGQTGKTVFVGPEGNVGLWVSGNITVGGELKSPGLCVAPSFNKPRIAAGIVNLIADGCCASIGYLPLPGGAVALDRVIPVATFLGGDYRGYTIEAGVPDLYEVLLRVKGTNSGKVYVIAVYDAQ